MRIRITASGIYGAAGEIPIGEEFDVKEAPKGWEGRYAVIKADPIKGAAPIPNRAELEARAKELKIKFDAKATDEEIQALVAEAEAKS